MSADGAEARLMISLYDRVRVRSGDHVGQVGTIVEIDRRVAGPEVTVVYRVRFADPERVAELAESDLDATGESALPFRFGEVVRIARAGDPTEWSYIGHDAVVRGAAEGDDGTFVMAVLPEGDEEIRMFHESDLTPTGRFTDGD